MGARWHMRDTHLSNSHGEVITQEIICLYNPQREGNLIFTYEESTIGVCRDEGARTATSRVSATSWNWRYINGYIKTSGNADLEPLHWDTVKNHSEQTKLNSNEQSSCFHFPPSGGWAWFTVLLDLSGYCSLLWAVSVSRHRTGCPKLRTMTAVESNSTCVSAHIFVCCRWGLNKCQVNRLLQPLTCEPRDCRTVNIYLLSFHPKGFFSAATLYCNSKYSIFKLK